MLLKERYSDVFLRFLRVRTLWDLATDGLYHVQGEHNRIVSEIIPHFI